MMQHVVLLLLGAHLASAGTHSLRYVYTTVSGIGDFPEYTSVGLVDDEQFDYFDSKIMKAVPKTEWMRQNVGADYWDKVTQIHIDTHQSFKTNIQEAKERFNHTSGDSLPIGIIGVGVAVAVLLLIVNGVVVYKVYQKKKGLKPVNASDDGSIHSVRSVHSRDSSDSVHSEHSDDSLIKT